MVNPRNLEQEDILDFIDQWLEDQNETTEITKTVAFNLGAKYLGVFSSRSLKMREKYISFAQSVLLSLYIF
jgi:hypothetical protein